jgi:hypothetical protein
VGLSVAEALVGQEASGQYRRRRARLAATAVAAIVVAAAAVPLARSLIADARHPATGTPRTRLFPGGGRLLVIGVSGLTWLYPDGRKVVIAPAFTGGFAGASIAGPRLLAWRLPHPCGTTCFPDVSYYTMNLDGSGARLVLAAEPERAGVGFYHQQVQLSPDGTMLGYVRARQLAGGRSGSSELWTVDLATHRRFDLGPFMFSTFVWQDDSTLLADSAGGRALELINARTAARTRYLSVGDPAIARAYERVRPRAGAPATIGLIGWSPGPHPVLAVSAAVWRHGNYALPAVELVAGSHVVAFAPNRRSVQLLTLGPAAAFVLATGEGDCPACWQDGTFAGSARGSRLWRQPTFGEPFDSALFSPGGGVVAFWYDGGPIAFAPLAGRACVQAGVRPCLRFAPKALFGQGTPQAWVP